MKLTKLIDGLIKTAGRHRDSRYALDTVRVTTTYFEVTNGYACYTVRHNSDTAGLPDSFLIPAELIERGKKIRGKDGVLTVSIVCRDTICLSADGKTVSTKLPTKDFPDIRKIYPNKDPRDIQLVVTVAQLEELIAAVKKQPGDNNILLTIRDYNTPVVVESAQLKGALMPTKP